jgi:hypothetical protein
LLESTSPLSTVSVSVCVNSLKMVMSGTNTLVVVVLPGSKALGPNGNATAVLVAVPSPPGHRQTTQ